MAWQEVFYTMLPFTLAVAILTTLALYVLLRFRHARHQRTQGSTRVATHSTLGLQLVNTLVGQLEGVIELDESGGTVFKITFDERSKLRS